MSNTYPVGIRIARLSYLDEIPSASAALRYLQRAPLDRRYPTRAVAEVRIAATR
jgi:hypothetical protein